MTRILIAALSVLALTGAAKAVTAAGTVTAVTTQSLTIVSGGTNMTFTIDGTTKFVAKGLSTKSAKNKIMATDAVAVDDVVRVTYHDLGGGAMHAATVRVTTKAGAKPKP
jgi:hypothetical protein